MASLVSPLVSAQAGISRVDAKVNDDVMKKDYSLISEEFLSQTLSDAHLLNYQYYNI
ncbi:hypothetical protein [Chryseobacterium sp. SIMBA_038]|uniref:hypothetical protein n=1 Tax=Chryseobacterium sp. SIMBA_038 TaxID=3085780 RepID=UPI003978611B